MRPRLTLAQRIETVSDSPMLGRHQCGENARWMGRRSYRVRRERFGLERLQAMARENGRQGWRPRKGQVGQQSARDIRANNGQRHFVSPRD